MSGISLAVELNMKADDDQTAPFIHIAPAATSDESVYVLITTGGGIPQEPETLASILTALGEGLAHKDTVMMEVPIDDD